MLVQEKVKPFLASKSDIKNASKKMSDKSRFPLQIDKYTGNYYNPIYGKITIKKQNSKLTFKIGPRGTKLVLNHKYRDVFSLLWPQSLDADESSAVFNLDITGNPIELAISAYGTNNILFKRQAN